MGLIDKDLPDIRRRQWFIHIHARADTLNRFHVPLNRDRHLHVGRITGKTVSAISSAFSS